MNIDIKYIIKRIIIGIVVGMVLILFSAKVNAQVIRTYDYTTTINNTRYYLYNIPTRSYDEGGSYSVSLARYNGYSNNLLTKTRGNQLKWVDNITDKVALKTKVFSPRFRSQILPSSNNDLREKIAISYSMGISTDTASMLEDGRNFNYNARYNYKFYLIIRGITNSFENIPQNELQVPNSFDIGNELYGCRGEKLYGNKGAQENMIIIEYFCTNGAFKQEADLTDVELERYSNNPYILTSSSWTNPSICPPNSWCSLNGALSSGTNYPLSGSYEYYFSAPYDIQLISEYDKFILSKLWTQQDSDNINQANNRYNLNDDDTTYSSGFQFFVDAFNSITVMDGGIGSVILSVINLFRSIINPICRNYTFNIVGANITLPNGCDFWNRQELYDVKVIWKGILSTIILIGFIRIVYKDIVNAFTPNYIVKDVLDL